MAHDHTLLLWSPSDRLAELENLAGVQMTGVHYRGAAPALTDRAVLDEIRSQQRHQDVRRGSDRTERPTTRRRRREEFADVTVTAGEPIILCPGVDEKSHGRGK
jgi:hypothetical protein